MFLLAHWGAAGPLKVFTSGQSNTSAECVYGTVCLCCVGLCQRHAAGCECFFMLTGKQTLDVRLSLHCCGESASLMVLSGVGTCFFVFLITVVPYDVKTMHVLKYLFPFSVTATEKHPIFLFYPQRKMQPCVSNMRQRKPSGLQQICNIVPVTLI